MLSVAATMALSIWLIHWVILKLSATASRSSRINSYLGGYGAYPFALFLSLSLAVTSMAQSATTLLTMPELLWESG